MGGKERSTVRFGHQGLVRLLRYPGCALFIEGTAKMVPKPFSHCLIFMVLDQSFDVYVPVAYV